MTLNDLSHICQLAHTQTLARFEEPLRAAMAEFGINTPLRAAAFIAQVAHESAEFRYLRELASGAAYEGRHDLGNTQPGDGERFKGRGLIQITGRANYEACGQALGLALIDHPELLETSENACRSAGWFWAMHKLNALADIPDFQDITRRINGGLNGEASREAYYAKAKAVLEASVPAP